MWAATGARCGMLGSSDRVSIGPNGPSKPGTLIQDGAYGWRYSKKRSDELGSPIVTPYQLQMLCVRVKRSETEGRKVLD